MVGTGKWQEGGGNQKLKKCSHPSTFPPPEEGAALVLVHQKAHLKHDTVVYLGWGQGEHVPLHLEFLGTTDMISIA